MVLTHAFCQKLGLRRLLQRCLRPAPRTRDFQPAELLSALVSAIIVGLERIDATLILQHHGAFQSFEAHRQEFWHGRFRSGNTLAATGTVPFLRVCLAKAPPGIARARIRGRGGSGFFGKWEITFLSPTRSMRTTSW